MNRNEGSRHEFAAALLGEWGRSILIPWPIVTEVDLLLRARGHHRAALVFAEVLLAGSHRLHCPFESDLGLAVELSKKYEDLAADLPDFVVMAVALNRDLPVLTWDFRHFRVVLGPARQEIRLVVQEYELPES